MAAKDPELRRLIASLGGTAQKTKYPDRRELTRAATEASQGRWIRQARELHPTATEEQVSKVADALMRQHMIRMVLARKRAAKLRAEADRLEVEVPDTPESAQDCGYLRGTGLECRQRSIGSVDDVPMCEEHLLTVARQIAGV